MLAFYVCSSRLYVDCKHQLTRTNPLYCKKPFLAKKLILILLNETLYTFDICALSALLLFLLNTAPFTIILVPDAPYMCI